MASAQSKVLSGKCHSITTHQLITDNRSRDVCCDDAINVALTALKACFLLTICFGHGAARLTYKLPMQYAGIAINFNLIHRSYEKFIVMLYMMGVEFGDLNHSEKFPPVVRVFTNHLFWIVPNYLSPYTKTCYIF